MGQLMVLGVVFFLLLAHACKHFRDKSYKSQRLVGIALLLLTISILLETLHRGLEEAYAYGVVIVGSASLLLLLFALFNPREREPHSDHDS